MKYCTHCGAQIPDESRFCPQCGGAADIPTQPPAPVVQEPSTLLIVAKVFMIITCVAAGFALFPLCWVLPMTIHYNRALKSGAPISLGFKICTLLFVNTVAGILMLCDGNN